MNVLKLLISLIVGRTQVGRQLVEYIATGCRVSEVLIYPHHGKSALAFNRVEVLSGVMTCRTVPPSQPSRARGILFCVYKAGTRADD
jgi:hypothetical protein